MRGQKGIILKQKTKTKSMIDTKSKLVLKILKNECKDGSYKIIEIADIISSLPRHYKMDSDTIKNILNYLERQDLISIKYDDDDVYCVAIMPYGFEIIENEKNLTKRSFTVEKKNNFMMIILTFFSSLIGTILGIIICYLIIKM